MHLATRCICLGLMCLLATQPGCLLLSALLPRKPSNGLDVSLLKAQGYSIPPGGMPAPVVLDPNDGPRIILEIRGDKRHLETIPCPENGMFIEDLVQQAKLHENFGQLGISIMRPIGNGAPPVRMDLKTDDDGKATHVSQNYGLLAGDHIIVFPDDRSHLERFIAKTTKMN